MVPYHWILFAIHSLPLNFCQNHEKKCYKRKSGLGLGLAACHAACAFARVGLRAYTRTMQAVLVRAGACGRGLLAYSKLPSFFLFFWTGLFIGSCLLLGFFRGRIKTFNQTTSPRLNIQPSSDFESFLKDFVPPYP